jgi:hypothetical protein
MKYAIVYIDSAKVARARCHEGPSGDADRLILYDEVPDAIEFMEQFPWTWHTYQIVEVDL